MAEKTIHELITQVLNLNHTHAKHFDSVSWLVSEGNRRSGRSYLLAAAFVEEAIKTNQKIFIWDHYSRGMIYHLFSYINEIIGRINKELVKANPNIIFVGEINETERSLRIYYRYLDDK